MAEDSPFGPEIWVPLVIMICAVYLFFVISLILSTRTEILIRERRSQWVVDLVAADKTQGA
jgi:heme exporter protein C